MRQGARDNLPPPNLKRGTRWYQGNGATVDHQVTTRVAWFRVLLECLQKTECHDNGSGKRIALEDGLDKFSTLLVEAHRKGGKAIFIGNGGSAAIASHMSCDYSKNKGVRALAFNDAPMLTMLANDYGYQNVFAKQIEYYGRKADVAIIVSSSGRSLNILAAADTAHEMGMRICTFSGMNPNNVLRAKGDLNFYTPSVDYGLVELTHLALLHSVVSV